jgi:hypothetical protein
MDEVQVDIVYIGSDPVTYQCPFSGQKLGLRPNAPMTLKVIEPIKLRKVWRSGRQVKTALVPVMPNSREFTEIVLNPERVIEDRYIYYNKMTVNDFRDGKITWIDLFDLWEGYDRFKKGEGVRLVKEDRKIIERLLDMLEGKIKASGNDPNLNKVYRFYKEGGRLKEYGKEEDNEEGKAKGG